MTDRAAIEARLRAVPMLQVTSVSGDYGHPVSAMQASVQLAPDYAALAALVEELLVAHGITCADSAVAAGAAWAKKAVDRATEIDALQAQLDAKTSEAERQYDENVEQIATRAILEREIARLREALDTFGVHLTLCMIYKRTAEDIARYRYPACTCGLAAALAGPEGA